MIKTGKVENGQRSPVVLAIDIAIDLLFGLVLVVFILDLPGFVPATFNVQSLFGYQARVILSASMEPALPVGSMVYIDTRVPFSELAEGDIIAFEAGEGSSSITVAHRVASIDSTQGQIATKGDANEDVDSGYVTADTYIGVIKFHIPILGHLVQRIQANPLVCTAALLLVFAGLVLGRRAAVRLVPSKRKGA